MSPATFDESIWPARWTADLSTIAERIPQTVHIYVPQFEKQEDGEWELIERSRARPMGYFVECEPHGCGIVQRYVGADGDPPAGIELQTLLAVLRERHESEYAKGRPVRASRLRFLSWCEEPREELLDSDDVRDWMTYSAGLLFIPTEREPKAIAIVTGAGMKYDWEVRWRLVERGWAVLHLGMTSTVDARPKRSFEIAHPASDREHLRAAAREIAATVDDEVANKAYAAEAFLSYAREHEPALRQLPIVLVGFSAGALALPAIAARFDVRLQAAVLVTGGADVLDIALRTALTDQRRLRVTALDEAGGGRPLRRAERAELIEAYRAQRNLDPYHTAAALHGIPTLMIHGMFDRIVPASTGKVLHERLARPERWSYPLGHGGVFWLLPRKADRIIDWLERSVLSAAVQCDR